MCGIVGYTGNRAAAPLVLEGLKRLEYRGYDSAGLAIVNGGLEIFRTPGKIAALERELGANLPIGTTAIAHTRWATHGVPNTINAHPHADCGGTIALVHNGIIENAGTLRRALTQRGHVFRSQTDTEVLCHLIEETHTKGTPLVDAIATRVSPSPYDADETTRRRESAASVRRSRSSANSMRWSLVSTGRRNPISR